MADGSERRGMCMALEPVMVLLYIEHKTEQTNWASRLCFLGNDICNTSRAQLNISYGSVIVDISYVSVIVGR